MKGKSLLSALVIGGLALGGLTVASGWAPSFQEGTKKDEAKAKIGEMAPAFELKDIDGKTVKLADLTKEGKIVVLEWFNPACPFVKMHYGKNTTMNKLAEDYKAKGVVWLAINSGAAGKEGAGLDANKKAHTEWKMNHSILLDESGKVGKSYGSKNTPTMYIIDKTGKLVYWGAIDDATGNEPGKTNYVKAALDEVIAGQTVTKAQTKPYGCNVKYAD